MGLSKTLGCSTGMMVQRPIQVKNTKANYEIVSYNFQYRPLSCTVTSAYNRTVLANMRGVQLQVLTEKLLERLVRCESEQRHILGAAAELCHGQIGFTNAQQAAEETGPSEPSAMAFGSVYAVKQVQRGTGEDVFLPAIAETGNSSSQILVTGRFKPTLY